jgi:CDP-2,3-bis-(O-geranylgeranyl)-sn-glycerol synthase
MDIVLVLKEFFLIYLPPMVANGTPVIAANYIRGHPIDFGKRMGDGHRVLGDGKTFEGSIAALGAGLLTSLLLSFFYDQKEVLVLTGFVGSLGAIFGDILESFFKRRAGLERGEFLPLADQLDFYLGATLFIQVCSSCLDVSLSVYVLGLFLVPLLHYTTNYVSYKLGLKSVPW